MNIEKDLAARSGSVCELCGASNELSVYEVPFSPSNTIEHCIYICTTCKQQIEDESKIDSNHWRCLNDSMWSTIPAVQVMAWRMLNRMRSEGWPQDLLDMMYLDEEIQVWAQASGDGKDEDDEVKHVDSNGVRLLAGDTVVLVKDLNVKGAGFTAKRGTAVRGIGLVHDNPEQIEGRVNGQQIVILTQYVKKQTN